MINLINVKSMIIPCKSSNKKGALKFRTPFINRLVKLNWPLILALTPCQLHELHHCFEKH